MEYVHDGIWLAGAAFTVWMLVDAYRRPAEGYWPWVILFVPVVGPLAYFFAVKLGDFPGLREFSLFQFSLFQRRPGLDELRYRAQHTPTLSNHLALAQRLVERGEHEEAVPHLEAVLVQEPGLAPALYALAVCHVEQGQPDKAVPELAKIIQRERGWSNYAAWYLLIRAHEEAADGEKVLAVTRDLARLAPTLRHQCLLAEKLFDAGQTDEARELLERSLEDHQFAPGFIRRRNRRWASRARQLHKQMQAR
jgi:hypothetical protein